MNILKDLKCNSFGKYGEKTPKREVSKKYNCENKHSFHEYI